MEDIQDPLQYVLGSWASFKLTELPAFISMLSYIQVTYVAIREKFQSTAAITSWIGGINVGLRFFLGLTVWLLSLITT